MSGFNPTLTIQALAYMTADAIVNKYKKRPGPADLAAIRHAAAREPEPLNAHEHSRK